MILQALCSYYRRASNMEGAEVIRPGYARLGVSAELVLDREGNLIAANPLYSQSDKKKLPRQLIVPLPPKRSGQKPEAAFLYENVAFIFGIYPKPDGADYRFDASKAIHEAVLGDCADPGARALMSFFKKRTQGFTDYQGVDTSLLEDPRLFVVFRLHGDDIFLHQRFAIAQAWEAYCGQANSDSPVGQCMITGKMAPIARIHGNVSGFGADKPTLIGFNQDAFCSFGKYGKQGANAPVSEKAAFEYVTALNMLCNDPCHCINLAGDKVVFWAERDAPDEENIIYAALGGSQIMEQLDVEQRDRIKMSLDKLYKGGNPRDCRLDANIRFYILGLNANKTRLVIRFFNENNFGVFIEHLMAHYRDIGVSGMRYAYPSPYQLLLETAVQRKRDNIPPNIESALMRSILEAIPYPTSLQQAILRRIRAEGEINPLRAGVLKAIINRLAGKEVMQMSLDTKQDDRAYLLGRLFALIEKTQEIALGQVNSSITDKYLNSALATPQMVFPVLLSLNTKHLSKSVDTEKQRNMLRGLHHRITQVIDMLNLLEDSLGKYAFPNSMDANEQGKFLVGFYHQIQNPFYKADDTVSPDGFDERTGENNENEQG